MTSVTRIWPNVNELTLKLKSVTNLNMCLWRNYWRKHGWHRQNKQCPENLISFLRTSMSVLPARKATYLLRQGAYPHGSNKLTKSWCFSCYEQNDSFRTVSLVTKYRGADKSLARPTSQCILFDGESISFNASLVIYVNSTNISPIMIINRIYEHQNLLSL